MQALQFLADMATKIGPVTIAADMHDEDIQSTTDYWYWWSSTYAGEQISETDTGVTVSLDAPIGDATIGLDNSGN